MFLISIGVFRREKSNNSMPVSNVRKQTPKEFNGYFKDVLQSLIRKTFNQSDELLFVTYQPEVLTLDPIRVSEHTAKLFNKYKYVEVLEQTFKKSNRYNDSNYIGGYHSHILIKEIDFKSIQGQLDGFDIVDKVVYDLDSLTNRYLSKQAGELPDRLLPTNHIPKNNFGPESPKPLRVLIKKAIQVFKSVLINQILQKFFRKINKIDTIHMFLDDT